MPHGPYLMAICRLKVASGVAGREGGDRSLSRPLCLRDGGVIMRGLEAEPKE